jgi:hypothetical protein
VGRLSTPRLRWRGARSAWTCWAGFALPSAIDCILRYDPAAGNEPKADPRRHTPAYDGGASGQSSAPVGPWNYPGRRATRGWITPAPRRRLRPNVRSGHSRRRGRAGGGAPPIALLSFLTTD